MAYMTVHRLLVATLVLTARAAALQTDTSGATSESHRVRGRAVRDGRGLASRGRNPFAGLINAVQRTGNMFTFGSTPKPEKDIELVNAAQHTMPETARVWLGVPGSVAAPEQGEALEAESPPESSQTQPEEAVRAENEDINLVAQPQPASDACDARAPGCQSLCRWLKLTDHELREGWCLLYEHPLSTCGYVSPELRHGATPLDSLDCTVSYVRMNVTEADVASNVDSLELCMDNIETEAGQACAMALDFLRSEIADYRNETSAKAAAAELAQRFAAAGVAGREALSTKRHVDQAIQVLNDLLTQAEGLPGNYLERDMEQARELADSLAPIPTVRVELHHAIDDGRQAMRTETPFAVEKAIVWLTAAISKAQRYDVGPPIPTAVSTLASLQTLHQALVTLEEATFVGNVSLGSKADMPMAIQKLTSALGTASENNVSTGAASDLLTRLVALDSAVQASKEATAAGQHILTTAGLKGWDAMSQAVEVLNRTLTDALALGLENDVSTLDALETRERLVYIIGSRESLHSAVVHGLSVLDHDRDELNDDEEEAARQRLEPAIQWGQDVGLVKGLGVAREILEALADLEGVKEHMVGALALANASIDARAGEGEAIGSLAAAIAGSEAANATGGVDEARRKMRLLVTRKVARDALARATRMAKDALERHASEAAAVIALNASVDEAVEAGLVNESQIAMIQLERLEAFLRSEIDLHAALNMTTPMPGKVPEVDVNDTQPDVDFQRMGVRIVDLPEVENAEDDGDDDFEEHLAPLEEAIAAALSEGEMDPEMERQLARERALRDAFELMQAAIARGNASFAAKDDLEGSILDLTIALQEAGEEHLLLGVADARSLLASLNTIKPARDELAAAIREANISAHTVSGMDRALVRLSSAIAVCEDLRLTRHIPEAMEVREGLAAVRAAFISIKAAVVQGQLALSDEEGEEAAVNELTEAIDMADKVAMHKQVPIAVDLLHELAHMNAQHQQMQAAMSPAH